MLILYMRPGCGHYQKVEDTIKELGLTVEERDITNILHAEELREQGGKRQIPYLVDTDRGVSMYESEDIVSYLKTNYAK